MPVKHEIHERTIFGPSRSLRKVPAQHPSSTSVGIENEISFNNVLYLLINSFAFLSQPRLTPQKF